MIIFNISLSTFYLMSLFKKTLSPTLLAFVFVFSLQSKSYAQDDMLSDFSYLYMEKLIAVAKEKYPKSKTFDHSVEIAGNNVSIAKASWLDPFSFSYSNRSNLNTNDVINPIVLSGYFMTFSLSPISLLVKTPYQVKNAKEELRTAKAQRDEYAIQLESEVKRRYIIYIQAKNALKLISKRMVDTESSYNYMKTRYERSEITFAEFNDVSTTFNATQEAKISAQANFMTAKFSLEELLTVKLEDIK